MKSRITAPLLTVFAGLLFVAVVLQVRQNSRIARLRATEPKNLAVVLPTALGGTAGRNEEIASTQEMKEAVGELLNYDDAVFRIYQLPSYRLSVYAAWWNAGKMSPRLVASHTPDVCWPGSGWVRDAAEEAGLTTLSGRLNADGFAGGECRVFKLEGAFEHVVFWHKVGEEMQSYGTGHAPPWWAVFHEIRRDGLNLRKEQLFVRISSNKPLAEVWDGPELEPLKASLRRLGLKANAKRR